MPRILDVNSQHVVTLDGVPYTNQIVELYENYDRSFADWCDFHYRKDGPDPAFVRIPTVFATPERAFSQYGKILEDKYKKRFNPETIPLPMISMSRSSFVEDESRRQTAKIRKRFISLDHKYWVGGNYPIPVNLGYEINLWSKTLKTADVVRLELFRKFYRSRLVVMDVFHPLPVSWIKVIMKQTGFADNTSLEPGTVEERSIRHTYSFEIEGWLTYPYEVTHSVLTVHQEIFVQSRDETSTVLSGDINYTGTEADLQRNFADQLADNNHGGMVE